MSGAVPRFGHVAVVGRPNVGKSTLINRLTGEPVSIVTHKPQTTRHRILGILTTDRGQAAFVDTPGLHDDHDSALNRRMNAAARAALRDVDAAVVVVPAAGPATPHAAILSQACRAGVPVILVVNKIDLCPDRGALLPRTETLVEAGSPEAVFYVSALRDDGVDDLREKVFDLLPEAPPAYDPDWFTDRPVRFLVAELVREQLMLNLHEELPYELAVGIERFEEGAARTEIDAVIVIAEKRHKGMVIGRGGEVLKRVGTHARQRIRELLGRPVHLKLWVRVEPDWLDDEARLQRSGYTD